MENKVGYCNMVLLPCLVFLALLLLGSRPAAAITCGDAVTAMAPCGGYLVGSGYGDPTPQCCQSVQSLGRMAATGPTRRAMCECFKQTGPSFGVKPERVRSLVAYCKLPVTLPISPNVDCNHV